MNFNENIYQYDDSLQLIIRLYWKIKAYLIDEFGQLLVEWCIPTVGRNRTLTWTIRSYVCLVA